MTDHADGNCLRSQSTCLVLYQTQLLQNLALVTSLCQGLVWKAYLFGPFQAPVSQQQQLSSPGVYGHYGVHLCKGTHFTQLLIAGQATKV